MIIHAPTTHTMHPRLTTVTLLMLGLFYSANSAASPLIMGQAELIDAACRVKNSDKQCAKVCKKLGFKDSFSEVESLSNADNTMCQFALATQWARALKIKNTANIKLLTCNKATSAVCQGDGWRVSYFSQEAGSGVKIRAPGGKTTTLAKCGTCNDNLWKWQSGPLKQALVKAYRGGVMLILDATLAR